YFMHLFPKLKYPSHILISLSEFNSQNNRCFSSLGISDNCSKLKYPRWESICLSSANSGSTPRPKLPSTILTSKNNSTACKGGSRNSWTNKNSPTSTSSPVSSRNSLLRLSDASVPYSIPPPGTLQNALSWDI